jgi:hypothetical protein
MGGLPSVPLLSPPAQRPVPPAQPSQACGRAPDGPLRRLRRSPRPSAQPPASCGGARPPSAGFLYLPEPPRLPQRLSPYLDRIPVPSGDPPPPAEAPAFPQPDPCAFRSPPASRGGARLPLAGSLCLPETLRLPRRRPPSLGRVPVPSGDPPPPAEAPAFPRSDPCAVRRPPASRLPAPPLLFPDEGNPASATSWSSGSLALPDSALKRQPGDPAAV